MSSIMQDLIWQHDKVLPYLLGGLKQKIEAITPVQNMYLYGSRARVPFENWQELEGKDWDVLVVCSFPIINTKIWTLDVGYYIDLKVTNMEGTENFFKYSHDIIQLYPENELDVNKILYI